MLPLRQLAGMDPGKGEKYLSSNADLPARFSVLLVALLSILSIL